MGIMGVTTPAVKAHRRIPRRPVDCDLEKNIGRIGISFYRSQWNGLTSVRFTNMPDVVVADDRHCLDLLWRVSWPLSSPRPGWFGYMQTMVTGDYPGKSSPFFLPLIDMNPSDLTCIYSTLCFVSTEAKKLGVTPIVTFDQPLFWKAQMITHSEKSQFQNMVVRLGMFHTLMSFLGCIGYVMQGSGFRECLEQVYAPNAVTHMLSGKAYARAMRGHELMDAALHAMVLAEAYDMPWILAHLRLDLDTLEAGEDQEIRSLTAQDEEEESGDFDACDPYLTAVMDMEADAMDNAHVDKSVFVDSTEHVTRSYGNEDLDEMGSLFEKLLKKDLSAVDVKYNETVERVGRRLADYRESLKRSSRTSMLWINYLEMVHILKIALMAERTGDFNMHLWAVKEMLPYFAACGHNFYVKSARLYLQCMTELRTTKPLLFAAFQNGLHVMRRSERFWAGISSDLMIEQVLMRSLKSSGGLTRGRGFGERERTTWLLAMPACAEVSSQLKILTGVDDFADKPHKESTMARQQRDHNDIRKILTYLLRRSPFSTNVEDIVNISTGKTACKASDVDRAREVGEKLIESMTGQSVTEVTFKKRDQATQISSPITNTSVEKVVSIDPQLLFQRLLTAGQATSSKLQEVLTFELATAPPSLFDACGMMRSCQKSVLATCLWSKTAAAEVPPPSVHHVIDGGSLLHKISWPRGATYRGIADMYVNYVLSRHTNATVIFDGYLPHTTTKDSAHIRRGLKSSPDILISPENYLDETKDSFLSNNNNKQNFINLLSHKLSSADIGVGHAKSDADTLIVQHVLQSAINADTVLVGEDTDLLILLLYHVSDAHHRILFSSSSGRIWDIQRARSLLGDELCKHLLFLHAFTGCDTSSHPYSIGKRKVVSKFNNSPQLREAARSFMATSESEAIVNAGEKAMVILYGGSSESLDELRYRKYMKKVASQKKAVQPYTLPPTSAASKFHSLRVYHQILIWKNLLDSTDEDPTNWGWQMINNTLHPIYTDIAPAPEELLNVITCNCKSDCSTLRCICRKHGLNCSLACIDCQEGYCTNIPQVSSMAFHDSSSDGEECDLE